MKSNFKVIFSMAFLMLLLTQCKKEHSNFNAYFYTDKGSSEQKLTLFIDGQNRGELPFMPNHPTCDNDSLKQKALPISLSSGKYKLEAKDKSGKVVSSSTFKIMCNSMSTSSNIGGDDMSNHGECIVIGLFP